MVASEVGEESLLICDKCGYRANQEKAEYKRISEKSDEAEEELKVVETPNVKTIDQLVEFFKCGSLKFLKSIIYEADGKPVMVVITGDREINEHKLKNLLGADKLEIAPDTVVEKVTGAPVGFAGPVSNFKQKMVCDFSVKYIKNGITGANKTDRHYTGVNPGRDFEIKLEGDITSAIGGDHCMKCDEKMYEKKGIEVGHIFKLGYKYTESMNVTVLNENGKAVMPIMGCYGVGVNRTMAAIVEQHNDDRGIIWPVAVAPFHVHLVGIGKKVEEIKVIDEIYELLIDSGIEVLYDDRKASPGFKFADADLIGLPVRITVGKSYFQNGEIELKKRISEEVIKVKKEELIDKIKSYL